MTHIFCVDEALHILARLAFIKNSYLMLEMSFITYICISKQNTRIYANIY